MSAEQTLVSCNYLLVSCQDPLKFATLAFTAFASSAFGIKKLDFTHSVIHVLNFRDLCAAFGVHMLPLLEAEAINELLTQGRRSKTSKTKTLSQWATKEIRKLKNATSNSW